MLNKITKITSNRAFGSSGTHLYFFPLFIGYGAGEILNFLSEKEANVLHAIDPIGYPLSKEIESRVFFKILHIYIFKSNWMVRCRSSIIKKR